MNENEKRQIEAIVYGDVHGIGFRANTKNNADMLGLTGYVENLDDGTVRVVASGTEGRILALLDFLNIGPSNSKVEKVETAWSEADRDFKEFEIR